MNYYKTLIFNKDIVILLCAFFLLIRVPAIAQSHVIDVNTIDKNCILGSNVEYLFDDSDEFNIHNILNQKFLIYNKPFLNFGFTERTIFIKFQIENSSAGQSKVLVLLQNHMIDFIDFYIYDKDSLTDLISAGVKRKFNPEISIDNYPGFALTMEPGAAKTIVVRAKSGTALRMPLYLYTENTYAKKALQDNLIHGVFYGIIVFLIILNLILLFLIRDNMYVYYVLAIFFGAAYQLAYDNLLPVFFLKPTPEFYLHLFYASSALVFVFYTLFTEKFYGANTQTNYEKVIFKILYILIFPTFLIMLFWFYTGNVFMLYLALLFAIVYFGLSLNRVIKGSKHMRFYFIATTGFFIAIILYNLSINGLINSFYFFQYSLKSGFLFQGVVFTLAIFDRYLINQKIFNRLLQEKVTEKTLSFELQREELKKQSEILMEKNKKLKELDELRDGLTSMIVHDLKIPLHNIIHLPENIESAKLSKMVRQTGNHMLNLVMNILDVNKYESTSMQISLKRIIVLDTIQAAVEQVSLLSTQKNISIVYHLPHLLSVMADEEIISRVFINLLTNAIKFTPPNGVVTISYSFEDNNTICFKIIDSGPGIPKEKESLVFARFGQVVAKKTGDIRSTGIGLSFCKIAVEAHGGKIGFDSNKEKGTIFWFTIPTHIEKSKETVKLSGELSNSVLNRYQNMDQEVGQYLKTYVKQLKETEIYQISKILKILKSINSDNKIINDWKNDLRDAVYSYNNDLYQNLLNFGDLS